MKEEKRRACLFAVGGCAVVEHFATKLSLCSGLWGQPNEQSPALAQPVSVLHIPMFKLSQCKASFEVTLL